MWYNPGHPKMDTNKYKELQRVLRQNWTLINELLQEQRNISINKILVNASEADLHEQRGRIKLIDYIVSITE